MAKKLKWSRNLLNISFFIAAFSSIFWLIYGFRYINFQTLSDNNAEVLFQSTVILLFPIALMWSIFALIRAHYLQKRTSYCLYNILDLVKKNTDNIADLGKAILDNETEIKKNFVLQEFTLLISDINEILSDIIKRSNSVSSAQLEHLWTRATGGERWILAKTFIEIIDYQPGFSEHLQEKANKDSLLKGNILEFCARYKTICKLLQENDNTLFYNMIEYGALGKVFEILNNLSANIKKEKTIPVFEQKESEEKVLKPLYPTEENLTFPSFLSQPEDKTPTVMAPVMEKEVEKTSENIDAGLKAIRDEILSEKEDEPRLSAAPTPIISSFTQTQMALRNVKNSTKEEVKSSQRKTPVISLEELEKEINESPDNNYDEYAYPFGAWLNGKKN